MDFYFNSSATMIAPNRKQSMPIMTVLNTGLSFQSKQQLIILDTKRKKIATIRGTISRKLSTANTKQIPLSVKEMALKNF